MSEPLIRNTRATATGTDAIGIQIVERAAICNSTARGDVSDLTLDAGAELRADNVDYRNSTFGAGAMIEPLRGDRAVWDVDGYADRHASDIDDASYIYHLGPGQAALLHDPVTLGAGSDAALALIGQELTLTLPAEHDPVTLGAGSDAALSISGQELTLADVLTPTEHTAIGNSSPHHAPVTLGGGSDAALALSGQELTLTLPSSGKYRQFTYTVSGGDFTFIIDGAGNPVMALQDLE